MISFQFMRTILCSFVVLVVVANATTNAVGEESPVRQIDVDASQVKGPLNRAFQFSVGSDRAFIHLRPEHQRDLRFVRDTCGFKYIRFHGLLNEEMQLVKVGEDGRISYDWTNVDKVYDYLRDLGMRPIVELGFMPEPLASGNQTIFWWRGNVTEPKSYDQWADFIEHLVRHLTAGYGAEEVRKWYFEVWNEPNLDGFWPAGQAAYFKLYAYMARAIKKVDPAYRVGGPATAGYGWINETLDYCGRNELPIDFITTHAYGATEGFLDEEGKGHTMLALAPDSVVDGLPRVLNSIRNSKFRDLPVLVTEWGPSYSPRDPVHDSYFCAAWILNRLRRLPPGVEAMSYWTFSDQFEEAGLPHKPFHGGFGLLTMQGLPKPAYFAYRFLNELGDTELACDDANVWACGNDKGAVQVLLWDYTHPKQDSPNTEFFTRNLPVKQTAPVRLSVSNLAPGEYTVNTTRVGYRHNDIYTAYLDLGSPTGLPGKPWLLPCEVMAELQSTSTGEPETRKLAVGQNGALSLELPLNENDVYLIAVEPQNL